MHTLSEQSNQLARKTYSTAGLVSSITQDIALDSEGIVRAVNQIASLTQKNREVNLGLQENISRLKN